LIIFEYFDVIHAFVPVPASANDDLVSTDELGDVIFARFWQFLAINYTTTVSAQTITHNSVSDAKVVESTKNENCLLFRYVDASMAFKLFGQKAVEGHLIGQRAKFENAGHGVLLIPASKHINALVLLVENRKPIFYPARHVWQRFEFGFRLIQINIFHFIQALVAIEASHDIELILLFTIRRHVTTPFLNELDGWNEFRLLIFKIQNLALLYMVLVPTAASDDPEIVVDHMRCWTSHCMDELLF
jgi:hypothetical protein